MTVKELLEKLEAEDVDVYALDELVHNVAEEMASRANNEGPEGQVKFLMEYGEFKAHEIYEFLGESAQG